MARRVGSKPGQALRSRRHPPHWLRGCVVSGHALPPPPGIEVVAASPVFRCRRARPPARRPRCEPMVRRVGSKPGQVHLSCSPRGPQPLGPLSISHVIPSRLFQILNSQPWNCNVLGRSRKMTTGNYVRHYSVRSCSSSSRAGAWCAVCGVWCAVCGAGLVRLSCSPRVPQPLGPLSISHVIPSRLFQTLNSQRWNCNVLGGSRKMTAGNYVRHYSVRSGSGSLALECGAWCAARGARCAICGLADPRPRRAGIKRSACTQNVTH